MPSCIHQGPSAQRMQSPAAKLRNCGRLELFMMFSGQSVDVRAQNHVRAFKIPSTSCVPLCVLLYSIAFTHKLNACPTWKHLSKFTVQNSPWMLCPSCFSVLSLFSQLWRPRPPPLLRPPFPPLPSVLQASWLWIGNWGYNKVDTVGTMTTLTCQTLVKKGSKQKALDEYHRDLEVFYRGKNQSRLHFCVNKCPAFSQREGSGSMLVSSAIWVFLF